MHSFETRVWYEDTDMAGIVYHANYLKFIERARSDALRVHGVDQRAMKDGGLVFVVRRMSVEWRAPALYEDLLQVTTEALSVKRASAMLRQTVLRGGQVLFEAEVQIACMNDAGAPQRIPDGARDALGRLSAQG